MEITVNVEIAIAFGTTKEQFEEVETKVIKDFDVLAKLYVSGDLDDLIQQNK